MATASIGSTVLEVTCPDGVGEGTVIPVDTPDGLTIEVVVPGGIAPGEVFSVVVEEIAPRYAEILGAASEYLWSDELQDTFDDFCAQHRSLFADVDGVAGEQRLEWSEVHAAFIALYEQNLEDFLNAQGIETSEFADACNAALNDPNWEHCKGFVNTILAMGEYEYFINLMTGDVQISLDAMRIQE